VAIEYHTRKQKGSVDHRVCLAWQRTSVADFKVGLEEFRHLMRLELLREEPRKTALHTVIEEIVAYPCGILEMGGNEGRDNENPVHIW
jgi:uncharacterized membrane protein YidH (DUF202 family)